MADGFYAALNGEQAGPFGAEELAEMAASGEITGETQVWKEGMAEWAAAEMVEELSALIAEAAAKREAAEKAEEAKRKADNAEKSKKEEFGKIIAIARRAVPEGGGFLGMGDNSVNQSLVMANVTKAYKAGERSISGFTEAAIQGVKKKKEAALIQERMMRWLSQEKGLNLDP